MLRKLHASGLALVVGLAAQPAFAETPDQVLAAFQKEAKSTPGFQGFSAASGENFFKAKHGKEWSCASCHTDKPTQAGRHAKTDKPIAALAPAANAERFTDAAKVDKWFRRNCNDTVNRLCSAQEKADVMAWLLTIK